MTSQSRENLIVSDTESVASTTETSNKYDSLNETDDYVLSQIEKKFLLSAERGDCATVRR